MNTLPASHFTQFWEKWLETDLDRYVVLPSGQRYHVLSGCVLHAKTPLVSVRACAHEIEQLRRDMANGFSVIKDVSGKEVTTLVFPGPLKKVA